MQDTKSILQMARGAFQERVDLEMAKVIDNILDPNTKPTQKRKLTLTIEFSRIMTGRTSALALLSSLLWRPWCPQERRCGWPERTAPESARWWRWCPRCRGRCPLREKSRRHLLL